MIPPRIEKIEILEDFFIKVIYADGCKKLYDFKKNLKFDFYENLKNIEYFNRAKSLGTTIEWPNGEDIDPNELYENSTKINE